MSNENVGFECGFGAARQAENESRATPTQAGGEVLAQANPGPHLRTRTGPEPQTWATLAKKDPVVAWVLELLADIKFAADEVKRRWPT